MKESFPSKQNNKTSDNQNSLKSKDIFPKEDGIRLLTFGCRLNSYESSIMKSLAQSQGLSDVIIVNTCAVTQEAERQARQAVRRAHKHYPETPIIVTGCAAQIAPQQFQEIPGVSRVIGNKYKTHLESFNLDNPAAPIKDIFSEEHDGLPPVLTQFTEKSKAFLQIQNGCDHRCTFCTIPLGRGKNISIPMSRIIQQAEIFASEGYEEITLTGVDITGYGTDLPGNPSLGNLSKRLLKQVPAIKRLRLSSLDPIEIDPHIKDLLAHEPRFMPHLHLSIQAGDDMILKRMARRHLSIQAGDDMILKRMARRHLRQDVITLCQQVRSLRPDVVFGADIITGFPTETDEMFHNTLDLLESCSISLLHVFPYSPRPNTPAARMPQVPKAIGKERANILIHQGKKRLNHVLESFVGKTLDVLMETPFKGKSPHFLNVEFSKEHNPKDIICAEMCSVKGDFLKGHAL